MSLLTLLDTTAGRTGTSTKPSPSSDAPNERSDAGFANLLASTLDRGDTAPMVRRAKSDPAIDLANKRDASRPRDTDDDRDATDFREDAIDPSLHQDTRRQETARRPRDDRHEDRNDPRSDSREEKISRGAESTVARQDKSRSSVVNGGDTRDNDARASRSESTVSTPGESDDPTSAASTTPDGEANDTGSTNATSNPTSEATTPTTAQPTGSTSIVDVNANRLSGHSPGPLSQAAGPIPTPIAAKPMATTAEGASDLTAAPTASAASRIPSAVTGEGEAAAAPRAGITMDAATSIESPPTDQLGKRLTTDAASTVSPVGGLTPSEVAPANVGSNSAATPDIALAPGAALPISAVTEQRAHPPTPTTVSHAAAHVAEDHSANDANASTIDSAATIDDGPPPAIAAAKSSTATSDRQTSEQRPGSSRPQPTVAVAAQRGPGVAAVKAPAPTTVPGPTRTTDLASLKDTIDTHLSRLRPIPQGGARVRINVAELGDIELRVKPRGDGNYELELKTTDMNSARALAREQAALHEHLRIDGRTVDISIRAELDNPSANGQDRRDSPYAQFHGGQSNDGRQTHGSPRSGTAGSNADAAAANGPSRARSTIAAGQSLVDALA